MHSVQLQTEVEQCSRVLPTTRDTARKPLVCSATTTANRALFSSDTWAKRLQIGAHYTHYTHYFCTVIYTVLCELRLIYIHPEYPKCSSATVPRPKPFIKCSSGLTVITENTSRKQQLFLAPLNFVCLSSVTLLHPKHRLELVFNIFAPSIHAATFCHLIAQ